MHRKRNPSHSKEGNRDDAKAQDKEGATLQVYQECNLSTGVTHM